MNTILNEENLLCQLFFDNSTQIKDFILPIVLIHHYIYSILFIHNLFLRLNKLVIVVNDDSVKKKKYLDL